MFFRRLVRAVAVTLVGVASVTGVANALPYQHQVYESVRSVRFVGYHMHWSGCYVHNEQTYYVVTRHFDQNGYFAYATEQGPFTRMVENWTDLWC